MHSDAIKRRKKPESVLCMVKYLLDSNVIIDYLRGEENISRRLKETQDSEDFLSICSTVYYEVVRGFKSNTDTNRFRAFLNLCRSWEVLPFDLKAAHKAAKIYGQLHRGQMIEDNDIFIAATAIVNDCILVTANINHFGRVEGLNFVNWRNP